MKGVLSEKGQVTIPKRLRVRLGMRAGQVLDFTEESGRLVATKVMGDPIDSVFGILAGARPTDVVMEDMRGPTDRV